MLVRYLIFALVFTSLSFASFAVADDTQQPRDVFNAFKKALGDGDTDRAVSFISQNSIISEERVRRWSLELSRDELAKLDEMNVCNVLSYRLTYSRTKLEKSTGKLLLQESLSKRIATRYFAALSIEDVDTEGDIAVATLTAVPKSSQKPKLQFRKEDRGWKIDLEHYGRQSQSWYGPARKKSGLSKIDFGIHLLKKQFGAENISPNIVDGPRD